MWNSGYSGFLWILAGSKDPTSEDIHHVEAFYREIIKEEHKRYHGKYSINPECPKKYPTSCLLGVVDVQDV